jgi:predicted nucleic acid-binding protein
MRRDEALAMEGTGWSGDLDAMREADATAWPTAAALYRHCRARGETVRSTVDCLIAVVAMGHRATLLHRDPGFEVIARHTPLRTAGAGR